jgi:hypothetical protein
MFSWSLHNCKMCEKKKIKENVNQISHPKIFFRLCCYMWEVLPSQNVPNTTTLLSNVLCTKLSCFHLHNWLRHRGGISYFYLENKTFYFGDFSKFLSEVTWSKILFDQTLNWLLGTRIESTMVSSNGGITKFKKKIKKIIFSSIYHPSLVSVKRWM